MRTIKKEIIPRNFKDHEIYTAIKNLEVGEAVEISREEWKWRSNPYTIVYINFPDLRKNLAVRTDKAAGTITIARYR